MNIQVLDAELTRLTLAYLAASLIGFMVSMWVLYIVIKAAIRDGIQESGLVDTWDKAVRGTQDHAEASALKSSHLQNPRIWTSSTGNGSTRKIEFVDGEWDKRFDLQRLLGRLKIRVSVVRFRSRPPDPSGVQKDQL